jgi:hypothetical protein
MQHPLLDRLELRKLVDEIVEDVLLKQRRIPGRDYLDRAGERWWREREQHGQQDAITEEITDKIADWLEFRMARS